MKKILLASVLKPYDDTRMYEKFGLSLSKQYEVYILGRGYEFFKSKPNNHSNEQGEITFIEILKGESSLLKRIRALLTFLKICFQLKPEIIVVHSPELLPALALYQILSNVKTVYDVRENYYYNIVYQNNYSFWHKLILGKSLRFVENTSKFYIDGFILAERCYHEEFSFHRKKFKIIENKFMGMLSASRKPPSQNSWHFIYTGTISEIYGIWNAVDLIEKLHFYEENVRLTIIGHAVNQKIRQKLLNYVSDKSYITLELGEPLVEHSKIIDTLQKADFALLPYLPNKSTASCVPTKLYECLALQKPMVVQHNEMWARICDAYPSAIFIDFMNTNPEKLIHSLKKTSFYKKRLPNEEVSWNLEEKKLLEFISDL